MDNLLLRADSYKYSHFKQYPPGTTNVFSYMEPRGGSFSHVVTFGALRMVLRELFERPITRSMIDEADELIMEHMGPGVFNRSGWEHILRVHDGFIPLRVRAVREGLLVPIKNVVLTMENNDPAVPWLTNFFETACYPWYPYTIATLSFMAKQTILKALRRNGTPESIDFKLHDFGFRGTTDSFVGWQAAVGGLAHLVHFKGTDTVPALVAARKYYNCPMAGFSIPAAEHSTITSWTKDGEVDAYRNMLHQYPTGLVAVVSDSYDIYHACEKLWGEVLHDEVLNRAGTLVIRPDSGHPPAVVMRCLRILDEKFGSTRNQKGYRVLNPKVRLIQGDGVDPQMIDLVLSVMDVNGYSADNIAFGMGGALLQKVNRDTMKWAFKCSSIMVNGESRDVYKAPVTDSGKMSKTGRLSLYQSNDGHFFTAPEGGNPSGSDVMETMYSSMNGKMYFGGGATLDEIRARVPVMLHHPDCVAQHDDAEAQCSC